MDTGEIKGLYDLTVDKINYLIESEIIDKNLKNFLKGDLKNGETN